MSPKFVDFTFKKGSDWGFIINESFAGFSGYCKATFEKDKSHSLVADVIVTDTKVAVLFPSTLTENALIGNYQFDVELNFGELGNPNSSKFSTVTIARGRIYVIL